MTRVDLHLQSRFSTRVGEWALRKAGVAPSYAEPRSLYDELRGKGFPYFTLTDHHSIGGCLELEGLPGVFVSEKITAHFPEDRAGVDLLVWGCTQAQHERLEALRSNIFHVQRYLADQELAHAVAHPFHDTEGRLQNENLEKLLLLFKHFEGVNGMRPRTLNDFTMQFFRALTPESIEALSARHEMAATHGRPWEKVLVGGSGDLSGVFGGRAWTQTPHAKSVADLLAHLRLGKCQPAGSSGGPLTVAHGMYKRLGTALGERFEPVRRSALAQLALARFMEGKDPTGFSWREKLEVVLDGVISGKVFELVKPANASLWKALAGVGAGDGFREAMEAQLQGCVDPEERSFRMANLFLGRLAFEFVKSFIAQISEGNLIQAIQDLAVLIPVLAPLAPYFVELRREAPRLHWLRTISRSVLGKDVPPLDRRKVAWVTDTLEDVNGVSMTIRTLASAGRDAGFDVTVLSCRTNSTLTGVPLKNFEPIGEFALPEYELQKLAFPPVLEIVEYIYREGFTEIVLSTPGPVGLVGMLAARLLGLPVRGIYHTDFPRYIGVLTDDTTMESLAWTYMHWFYTGADLLYVNSAPYRDAWVARGADASKIRILKRGVDGELFNALRRSPDFWVRRGVPEGRVVLLYVGRVSKEKDLDMLVPLMRASGLEKVALAVVGDGPYLTELKELIPGGIFTGYLLGEDLAAAYASADVFVFPSTTDTYGNVVVEALSSGIPCVVSDVGGPASLVEDGCTGLVSRARNQSDFVAKVKKLATDAVLLAEMKQSILSNRQAATWKAAATSFFSEPNG
jgi:glycosyltransferase involved in cell wall biosynthesis